MIRRWVFMCFMRLIYNKKANSHEKVTAIRQYYTVNALIISRSSFLLPLILL